MGISVKHSMLIACRHFLGPVIRMLLHAGVTYKDFAEVSKRTYVEVAGDEFGIQGRKTNLSRVSILTGIGRKEVSRIREQLASEGPGYSGKMNPATRVMAAWHQDSRFTNTRGAPKPLSEDQLIELIEKHAGDIPAGALLKELQRVGAVLAKGNSFVAQARSFIPGRFDHDSIRMLGAHLHDLGGTISNNLLDGERGTLRFQRVVSNEAMDARALARFRKLSAERSEELLEHLDDWFMQNEPKGISKSRTRYRSGIGIYFFEDKIKQEEKP